MAGFTPEHENFQALVYRIAPRVSATFQDAETRMLAEVARRLIRDLPGLPELDRQLRIVQELERFAGELTAGITADLAEEIIAQTTREGAAAVLTNQLPRIPAISALTDAHVLAASLIARDLGNAFADVKARILRYPRDAVRQFVGGGDVYQDVIAVNAPAVALGSSPSKARKAARQEFLELGVTRMRRRATKGDLRIPGPRAHDDSRSRSPPAPRHVDVDRGGPDASGCDP